MHFKTKIYRHVLSRFDFKRVITLDNNPIQKPNGRRSLEGKGEGGRRRRKRFSRDSFSFWSRVSKMLQGGWTSERVVSLSKFEGRVSI